jgi:hypothetical protein
MQCNRSFAVAVAVAIAILAITQGSIDSRRETRKPGERVEIKAIVEQWIP